MARAILLSILLLSAAACATATDPPDVPGDAPAAAILFDDFSYPDALAAEENGWILRTAPGWPGVQGARWGKDRLSIHDDPDHPGNRVMRLTSSTDGTSENTRQSQFCHERKYLEGTYAARVRFTGEPVSGENGDQIVQTFYLISPLKAPMDLDYSEVDFEYLPNGGWGRKGATFFTTTWETFRPRPDWEADNESTDRAAVYDGWRILVVQIGEGEVRYFVDGEHFATHGGRVFPEVPMSINFNLWFIDKGLQPAGAMRTWVEEVDWVYHRAGVILEPGEVVAAVARLREEGVGFRDSVPVPVPPLQSPCDF
ncbi:MAG TPA: glycoside hydrolase family 16 protein [Thermoanaerobaculia bacterium]|nr:glycoside hydrolase family 16 protein [Thermoanaerobaculia bacterium]